ncbi:hypothetical protein ACFDTO_32830 [Microbacteriaceae bacterium 4G12]
MRKMNTLFYSAGMLLLLVGIGAVAAGIGFIMKPDGSGVGISLYLLKKSPFDDYLIPGIVLLSVNGIAGIAGAILAFMKKHYSGIATMILGVALMIWIAAQVYWIGFVSWLQPAFLAIGAIETALGFLLYEQMKEEK